MKWLREHWLDVAWVITLALVALAHLEMYFDWQHLR